MTVIMNMAGGGLVIRKDQGDAGLCDTRMLTRDLNVARNDEFINVSVQGWDGSGDDNHAVAAGINLTVAEAGELIAVLGRLAPEALAKQIANQSVRHAKQTATLLSPDHPGTPAGEPGDRTTET